MVDDLSVKHLALTSLTSLNSLTSPFAKVELLIQVSQVSPTRPERAEALSPGHRPGLFGAVTCRPVGAKALKLQAIYKAVALTGRIADCHYTQGDALG